MKKLFSNSKVYSKMSSDNHNTIEPCEIFPEKISNFILLMRGKKDISEIERLEREFYEKFLKPNSTIGREKNFQKKYARKMI